MDWYRRYHGTCADPKMRLVARGAGVPTPFAIAAWDAVLEHASAHEVRGSIDGMTAELLAMTIDCAEDQAQLLLAQFIRRGMVEHGHVARWSSRQKASDSSADRVRKYREKRSARPNGSDGCNGMETVTDHECNVTAGSDVTLPRARGSLDRTEQNREDKILPAAAVETPTPPAEQQRQEVVSSATLELLQKRLEGFGMSLALLERRVAIMVADRGSVAAVESALLQALAQARGDPLAYAQKILTNRATERIAAVEAAKAVALEPAEDPNLQAHRMTLEAIARMRANGEEFAGAYHSTADEPPFSPWPAIEAEPGANTVAEWPIH